MSRDLCRAVALSRKAVFVWGSLKALSKDLLMFRFRQGESMLKRRGIMQIGAVFGGVKTPYPEHRTAAAG